jgi:hypothetical protein
MPWETTEHHIRSGHRSPEEIQKDTLKTITLDEKEGVKAVVGKPKGKDAMEIQSYLFEKDKGWTLEKAKEWFKKHHATAKEHVYAVLPFTESKEEFDDVVNDEEFELEFGLGGAYKAVFSGCKWENATAPTRIEELVSLKAAFVAKTVTIS